MSWLDTYFFGLKQLAVGGVTLAQERVLNFVSGATAVDNPSLGRTDITIQQTPAQYTSMPTDMWTTPPTAASWPAIYGSPPAAVDLTGGIVTFNMTAAQNGAYGKTLASPGGSHVITFFVKPQIVPNSTADATHYSVGIAGSSKYVVINQEYVSNVMTAVVQRLNNADGTFDANVNALPADATSPFVPCWWRLTFDNTNLTIERCPIGSVYYTFMASTAHGCGAIQKAVVQAYGITTPAKLALLSYVET